MKKAEMKFFDRELSWLSFNHRVLQEAKDTTVPLYERIKFLAIWSSNLDEFFRVRVASLRSLLSLNKPKKNLKFDPEKLLKAIHEEVYRQQEEFGKIFRNDIVAGLENQNIFLLDENKLSNSQKEYLSDFFDREIIQHLQPLLLVKKKIIPFLQNQRLYLAVKLAPKKSDNESKRTKHTYSLVEIPDDRISRFIEIPSENGKHFIIFLDDIIRLNLHKIFHDFEVREAGSVKLTRDAELYIDDEFEGDLLEKIKKSLSRRSTGAPSRFLYDSSITKDFKKFLRDALNLSKEDMIPGGRYHNFTDFFSFPNPVGAMLEYEPMPPIRLPELDSMKNFFNLISEKDRYLYFPFHSYDYVIDFFEQASEDSDVKAIKVTQYRVAENSAIINSLLKAKRNGKDVMVFVELKARFDEERNIQWAHEMEKAGIKVFYSFPGLKVHSKIALISKKENGSIRNYCYLSTGNFNEKTARVYTDFGLFTAHPGICTEVEKVFEFLSRKEVEYDFEHLLVAQFNMRKKFSKLIEQEIDNAKAGKAAEIILKLNSLEDEKMIKKLYTASRAGVQVKIIVRGICRLIPGEKGLSDNIECISIVDRFLEHSRFYIFHNDGDKLIYAASADWMKRNLSRRIEIGFPVYDEDIKKEVLDLVKIQLNDNTKARIIDGKQSNSFNENKNERIRSQYAAYEYLKSPD